ncbi:hypothetical protein ACFCZ3_20140 [Cellulosimicrobium cellulans]|uniref:hypothetical protein n=1 Tax=Cellulosimicrobium cellulans TaxID=1710 RepID=UPI0035DFF75C
MSAAQIVRRAVAVVLAALAGFGTGAAYDAAQAPEEPAPVVAAPRPAEAPEAATSSPTAVPEAPPQPEPTPSATAEPSPIPACETEDADGPCLWDATTAGLAAGESFYVMPDGVVHYDDPTTDADGYVTDAWEVVCPETWTRSFDEARWGGMWSACM